MAPRAPRPPTRLTARATKTAEIPPANAARVTTASPVAPKAYATTAPTAAPPDTPRRYGSASGFRNDPWSAAPLAPRPAPTSAPRITRGSLRSLTIAMNVGSPRPRSASITPMSGTDTAPRATATSAIPIRTANSAGQYHSRKRVSGAPLDAEGLRVTPPLPPAAAPGVRPTPYPRSGLCSRARPGQSSSADRRRSFAPRSGPPE